MLDIVESILGEEVRGAQEFIYAFYYYGKASTESHLRIPGSLFKI